MSNTCISYHIYWPQEIGVVSRMMLLWKPRSLGGSKKIQALTTNLQYDKVLRLYNSELNTRLVEALNQWKISELSANTTKTDKVKSLTTNLQYDESRFYGNEQLIWRNHPNSRKRAIIIRRAKRKRCSSIRLVEKRCSLLKWEIL